jgi:hypothetical protein
MLEEVIAPVMLMDVVPVPSKQGVDPVIVMLPPDRVPVKP